MIFFIVTKYKDKIKFELSISTAPSVSSQNLGASNKNIHRLKETALHQMLFWVESNSTCLIKTDQTLGRPLRTIHNYWVGLSLVVCKILTFQITLKSRVGAKTLTAAKHQITV